MYKIFRVQFNNENMNVDLPEGYTIDGIINSGENHVTLALRKLPEPEVVRPADPLRRDYGITYPTGFGETTTAVTTYNTNTDTYYRGR